MTNEPKQLHPAPVERLVMPLCEGQIMLVYLEFDRYADKNWTNTEYLLKFGEAVSAATVGVICRDMGHNDESERGESR